MRYAPPLLRRTQRSHRQWLRFRHLPGNHKDMPDHPIGKLVNFGVRHLSSLLELMQNLVVHRLPVAQRRLLG